MNDSTVLIIILLGFQQDCVEQPFDTPTVYVSKNPNLAEEFAVSVKEYLMELEARIGRTFCYTVNKSVLSLAFVTQ